MPYIKKVLLSLFSLISVASALYDGTTDVEVLTSQSEFNSRVIDSDSIWIVQFFAPWCGHCKQFTEPYNQMGSLLKGIVPLAAIDATQGDGQTLARKYGVEGFPTMKLFPAASPNNKKKVPEDLDTRDPNVIINTVFQKIQDTISERGEAINDGGYSSSSSSSSSSGSRSGSSSGSKGKNNVVKLTASNFAEKVYNNPEVSLVAFIAPWCGHCKALHPEWDDASVKLEDSGAFLGTVDATEEESLAAEFGIRGFPTIKIFPGGAGKTVSSAMDYEGPRDAEGIVQFALAEVDRTGVPKEIPELISEDVLNDTCHKSPNTICVFYALPHILDTGADGRNKYKAIMTEATKAVRGMAFKFIWFEGGSNQLDLENAMELTFGFPAVAAYSADKGVYAVHRGSFTETNIRKFLTGITTGRQPTYKLGKDFPAIQTTEPWDGLDGVPFEEEDLASIMGWDDDDDDAVSGEDEL